MAKYSVGNLCTFNHEKNQDWSVHKDRLEQWFLANDFETDAGKVEIKKRAVLLSSLTETTFKLVRDLALPTKLNVLSYDEIVKLLDGHCVPAKCGFAERNRFYSSTQRPTEEFAEWAARVRGLAADCKFSSTGLNDLLRDRFVIGMLPGPERDNLFTQDLEKLTFSKALDTAQAIRSAKQGAAQSTAAAAVVAPPVCKMAFGAARARHERAQRAASGASTSSSEPGRGQQAAPAGGACTVCGYTSHSADTCKFQRYRCKKCLNRGHLKRVCTENKVRQNFIEVEVDDFGDDGKRNIICNILSTSYEPMRESVLVNKVKINFEVDSGSPVTIIPAKIYDFHFKEFKLMPTDVILQTYSGSNIDTLGTIKLPFTYKNETNSILVFVVNSDGPCLLGKDFFKAFNLQIAKINNCTDYMEQVTAKYPKLFSNELGCYNGPKVKLSVKPGSKPVYFKARQVPFALRDKVELELNRLVDVGILVPVSSSEYASPIVPVLKNNGDIRLCADYSVSLNKQLVIDKYPLPRIEELFAKLHGGQKFSKLDLSQAYNQLVLDEDSQMLTCINTHKGLFKFTRLVFGLSSSAAIFQKTLEGVLAGMEGVLVFQDDILVTGPSDEVHLKTLNEVFNKLEQSGFVLQRNKCKLFQNSVSYLGFIIDKEGLHKCQDKIDAIIQAKSPTNVAELKSFLGMVNYYRHFIKNASSVMSPLHKLLQKNVPWKWGEEQNTAVTQIKRDLVSDVTLAHYDPQAQLILTVDAGPCALGAILSQVGTDGLERPISYASRSLSKAELGYSQIQKEATAIIFGIRKYHQYLYGRATPFVLKTDHKPLLSIFSRDKGIPEVTANRLQRYAIFLTSYNFTIEYVNSSHNAADYLSRSVISKPDFIQTECAPLDKATYLNFVYTYNDDFLNLEDISRQTQLDPILSVVCRYVRDGWPHGRIDDVFKPYFMCRNELSVEKSCLVRGYKVIIPKINQNKILNELHIGHLGTNKMKSEARNRFWWPGLSTDIDKFVASCKICMTLRPTPPRAPYTPFPYPPENWYRVHCDLLGPINNKTYLVFVDARSKWIECFDVSTGYGSKVIIAKLCEVMSRFGVFKTICTDNGTSFVSSEFEDFCKMNGIIHITSPAYNPSSNGQAESSVKIVKKALKSFILSGVNQKEINNKLLEFLFHYRNSEHSTTGRSPAEILFGSKLRNRLDLLKINQPDSCDRDLDDIVKGKQCSQGKYFGGKRTVTFVKNETVLVKVYKQQKTFWTKGVVLDTVGNSIYLVRVMDQDREHVVKKHVGQLLKYKGEDEYPMDQPDDQLSMNAESDDDDTPTELPPIVIPISSTSKGSHQDQVETPGTQEDAMSTVGSDAGASEDTSSEQQSGPVALIDEPVEPEAAQAETPSPPAPSRNPLRNVLIFKDYF